MTKVRIDSDEWYPVYSLRDDERPYGHEIEATDEQVARWEAASAAFQAAQEEMGALFDVAEDKAREAQARAKAEKEAAEKVERKRAEVERRAAAKDRERRQEAMWERIKESGGKVYDANGNPVGTVAPAGMGMSTGVRIEPDTAE